MIALAHDRFGSNCVVSLNANPCNPLNGESSERIVASSVSDEANAGFGDPSALRGNGFPFSRSRSANFPQFCEPLAGNANEGGDVVGFDGWKKYAPVAAFSVHPAGSENPGG